jgi:energy-coupling factor transporter ATP-binding protein EcfA2
MGRSVGLDELALGQFPHALSGGMQSRAALARALALAPDLLLMDEPFSALDIGLKAQLHRLLLDHQAAHGLAVLMITHDLMEAVRLADTMLVMAAEPGRIVHRVDLPIRRHASAARPRSTAPPPNCCSHPAGLRELRPGSADRQAIRLPMPAERPLPCNGGCTVRSRHADGAAPLPYATQERLLVLKSSPAALAHPLWLCGFRPFFLPAPFPPPG